MLVVIIRKVIAQGRRPRRVGVGGDEFFQNWKAAFDTLNAQGVQRGPQRNRLRITWGHVANPNDGLEKRRCLRDAFRQRDWRRSSWRRKHGLVGDEEDDGGGRDDRADAGEANERNRFHNLGGVRKSYYANKDCLATAWGVYLPAGRSSPTRATTAAWLGTAKDRCQFTPGSIIMRLDCAETARRATQGRKGDRRDPVQVDQLTLIRKNRWVVAGCTGTMMAAGAPPPVRVVTLLQVAGGLREDVDSNT